MKVGAFFLDFPGFLGMILGISWIFLDFLTRFLAFLGFLGKILGISWIVLDFLTRFLAFLGFLDKILGFSREVFCTKAPFCAFFQSKKLDDFLKFLARSCKIVHILGALGKNLVKILTKAFRKLQGSR